MLDLSSYRKKQNKFVLYCWIVINTVLSVAYLFEYIKGSRDAGYVMIFYIVTWSLLVCNIVLLYYNGEDDLVLRHSIGFSYVIFYAFVVFTSNQDVSFVYIIPMISVMIVYNDEVVILRSYMFAICINVINIIIKYMEYGSFTQEKITFYEIQMACLLLSGSFLVGAVRTLKFSYENMIKLNEAIELDELTGLYNRHLLTQKTVKYFTKEKEDDKINVTLAVIDIDNFKMFNDEYGHKFGDLVLKKVSKVIKLGVADLPHVHAFRTGGDEFLLLGRDTEYNKIYERCEIICKEIEKLQLIYNDTQVGVHVSIGVANTEDNKCSNYDDLYIEADANLYVAKNNGKNSVKRGDNLESQNVSMS